MSNPIADDSAADIVIDADETNGADTSRDEHAQRRILGPFSAMGIVLASTIGTGIFTTTGHLAVELRSGSNIVIAWLLGALVAFTGGLCVAELGAMMPHAGGSYVFARRSFGSVVGYLNGMVTVLIGYIAAIAVIALGFAEYVADLLSLEHVFAPSAIATVAIVAATAVHWVTVVVGARVNDLLCLAKVLIVVAFVVAGLAVTPTASTDPVVTTSLGAAPSLFSAAIAGGVVTTAFSYLGWSSAAEVGGEIRRPSRSIPIAVLGGIGVVTLLYVLLNMVFLRAAHPAEMVTVAADGNFEGIDAIGLFCAQRLFGESLANGFGIAIAILLASTLSTTVMAGARVVWAMARRAQLPLALEHRTTSGAPSRALLVQALIAIAAVWIGTLQTMLDYVGVLILAFSMLTMVSVIVLRVREPHAPRPFRVPLFPVPPIVNLAVGAWALASMLRSDGSTKVVLAALATVAVMLALMPLLARRSIRRT